MMMFISNGKLHVSACRGHHEVLTTFCYKGFIYITYNFIARVIYIYNSYSKKVVKT